MSQLYTCCLHEHVVSCMHTLCMAGSKTTQYVEHDGAGDASWDGTGECVGFKQAAQIYICKLQYKQNAKSLPVCLYVYTIWGVVHQYVCTLCPATSLCTPPDDFMHLEDVWVLQLCKGICFCTSLGLPTPIGRCHWVAIDTLDGYMPVANSVKCLANLLARNDCVDDIGMRTIQTVWQPTLVLRSASLCRFV